MNIGRLPIAREPIARLYVRIGSKNTQIVRLRLLTAIPTTNSLLGSRQACFGKDLAFGNGRQEASGKDFVLLGARRRCARKRICCGWSRLFVLGNDRLLRRGRFLSPTSSREVLGGSKKRWEKAMLVLVVP